MLRKYSPKKRLQRAQNFFKRLTAIILVINLIYFGIPYTWLTLSQVFAISPPDFSFTVRNFSSGEDFSEGVSLGEGEIAEFRLLVKNETEGNDIESLKFRAFFEATQNQTSFRALIRADDLPEQSERLSIRVPDAFYLDYVEGSTIYDFGKDETTRETSLVSDINKVSPLAFTSGFVVNNIIGAPNSWAFVYFRAKAVPEEPIVIHPDLDFFKFAANITRGERLSEQKTQTTAAVSETVTVQLFVHNKILESISHNVKVKDSQPAGTTTPQSHTATVSSAEQEDKTASITLNLEGEGEVVFIEGSAVVKDRDEVVVKTLNSGEVTALFGSGLLLNEAGVLKGCWEFMRKIEYKVKVQGVGRPGEPRLSIDKKIIFEDEEYDSVSESTHLYDSGEDVDYNITVKNVGEAVAQNVVVEDVLPLYLQFDKSEEGEFDSDTRSVSFGLGDLAPEEAVGVSYRSKVKEVLPQGDRTQENISTACADNAACVSDLAVIWINGPEIKVARVELEELEELPRDGGENLVWGLIYSLRRIFLGDNSRN